VSESPKYELSFSLNVLNHLGIGLYSNIPAVLSEMVANAWDAGATQVHISILQDEIVIDDNGRGMSFDEINQRFLRVGYQKRRDELTIRANEIDRHVMGRKGIGKLSVFSIANIAEIQTCNATEKNGFLMSLAEIEDGINKGSLQYHPQAISKIDISRGTRIILRDIRQPLMGVESELRTNLARRFSIIESETNFGVFVNGVAISLRDRNYYENIQFLWCLGDESQKYVYRCPNAKQVTRLDNVVDAIKGYKISGWVATVFKPKDIEDSHHAISIFAHGKLIQENILADIQDARLYAQYLIGEIDADFMDADDESDIVTSDRQRINQNDPRYAQLRQFIVKEILKKIVDAWDNLRKKHATKSRKPQTSPSDDAKGQGLLFASSPEISKPQADPGNMGNSVPGIPVITSPDLDVAGAQQNSLDGQPTTRFIPLVTTPNQDTDNELKPFVRPPSREAEAILDAIKAAVESSELEQEFKDVALYDLRQARLAYYSQAYKACVVMLGSVLEGLMLASLRRPNALVVILSDTTLPSQINKKLGGVQKPAYADRTVLADSIGELLSFDDYKSLIHKYIQNIEHLGVEDIQRFRNAIHPWVAVQKSSVYGTYNHARAMSYLGALKILTDAILAWSP